MVAKVLLVSLAVMLSQAQSPQRAGVWHEQALGLTMSLPEGFRLVTLPSLTSTMSRDPSRPLMAAQMGTQNFGIIGLISTITPSRPPYASVQGFLHAVVLANQAQGMLIEQEHTIQISPQTKLQEMVYSIQVAGAIEYDAAAVTAFNGSLLSFKVNAPTKEIRNTMLRSIETLRASN